MNVLAVDTAQGYLTVYLSCKGKESITYRENAGMQHSTLLLPQIDAALCRAGITLADIDVFGVVVGAGSFTGIRIGIATVKALAISCKKPIIPVTSFDVLAYHKTEGKYLAVINAKHGHYYVCGYQDGSVDIPPQYLPEGEVLALAKNRELFAYEEIINLPVTVVSPAVGLGLAIRAKERDLVLPENVQPLYVRKSQAEEGR